MKKIDRAIAFLESNRCMVESLKNQEDDHDIVLYIINIIKLHKTETPAAGTVRESR